MSVVAIYDKPTGLLPTYGNAAIVNVLAGNPDVVYCDIYFNDVYYKTLVSSSSVSVFLFQPQYAFYAFDIAGAAKEYLDQSYIMPTLNGSDVIRGGYGYVKCYCRLRGSTQSNGVWTPQADFAKPVQGTMDNEPVAGGGLYVDPFYFLNAAPQFGDWQPFSQYLRARCMNHYILRDKPIKIYTLQTNEEEQVGLDDTNYMSVLIGNEGFEGSNFPIQRYCTLRVYLYDQAGNQTVVNVHQNVLEYHNNVLHIPTGISNLKKKASFNAINFANFKYYYVQLHDTTYSDTPNNPFANIIARSPKYNILKNKAPNRKRLWFRNDLGVMQALNFTDYLEEIVVSSSMKQHPVYPVLNGNLNSTQAGYLRQGVRSNEITTLVGLFSEKEMETVMQAVKTSTAYIERSAMTYEAYNPSAPANPVIANQIRILDGQWPKRKIEDRWMYEVSIQYEMSMPNYSV